MLTYFPFAYCYPINLPAISTYKTSYLLIYSLTFAHIKTIIAWHHMKHLAEQNFCFPKTNNKGTQSAPECWVG